MNTILQDLLFEIKYYNFLKIEREMKEFESCYTIMSSNLDTITEDGEDIITIKTIDLR